MPAIVYNTVFCAPRQCPRRKIIPLLTFPTRIATPGQLAISLRATAPQSAGSSRPLSVDEIKSDGNIYCIYTTSSQQSTLTPIRCRGVTFTADVDQVSWDWFNSFPMHAMFSISIKLYKSQCKWEERGLLAATAQNNHALFIRKIFFIIIHTISTKKVFCKSYNKEDLNHHEFTRNLNFIHFDTNFNWIGMN